MNDAEQSLSVLALLSNPRTLKNIGLWQAELEENLSLARSVLENECVTESLTFLNVGIISLTAVLFYTFGLPLSGAKFYLPLQLRSFVTKRQLRPTLYVLDLDG